MARPEVVFHAAALKHLPLLEMHPDEGWKTNVGGTVNLLNAARRYGTARFVNVSTDKAANPTSVLGWTKRITERLTAHASEQGPTECVSVRFGNVLGSNGSVMRSFESQAAQGLPITVTHPDITRYFMTIAEASRLVVYAGAIGDPGEVLILDMGEPVRIMDVAERFAAQHEPPLEIVITGLRPNEKLHEDLIASDEIGECRVHKSITHVTTAGLEPTEEMSCGPVPDADAHAGHRTQRSAGGRRRLTGIGVVTAGHRPTGIGRTRHCRHRLPGGEAGIRWWSARRGDGEPASRSATGVRPTPARWRPWRSFRGHWSRSPGARRPERSPARWDPTPRPGSSADREGPGDSCGHGGAGTGEVRADLVGARCRRCGERGVRLQSGGVAGDGRGHALEGDDDGLAGQAAADGGGEVPPGRDGGHVGGDPRCSRRRVLGHGDTRHSERGHPEHCGGGDQ